MSQNVTGSAADTTPNRGSPPIPQRLRTMLHAHPDCLASLQAGLDAVAARAPDGIEPFERANWILENTLERYLDVASAQLEAAESTGDPEAIARAREVLLLMDRARSRNVGLADLSELRHWFAHAKEQAHG